MSWAVETIIENDARIKENEKQIAELKKQIKALQKNNKELAAESQGARNFINNQKFIDGAIDEHIQKEDKRTS